MSDIQNENRKRNKKRYGVSQNKRFKGPKQLEVGMEGIIITCNMNERKCVAEAYNLLNEYADTLYGPEGLNYDGKSTEEEDGDEDDVEAALKKEVAQLQASKNRERRFSSLDSGANNVIFMKTHNIDPAELVHNILSDLHATKKKKSRVILRMLPVSGTCKAFQEDMEKFLTTFLEPWFQTPNQATYQIAFKARNSSHNKRDEIIHSIAVLVNKMNPNNKVDLTNPELTVIVEIIRAVCCISVVKDYTLYRKYNVQEVVKEETAKPEEATEKKDRNVSQEEPKVVETEATEKKYRNVSQEEPKVGETEATEKKDTNVSQEEPKVGETEATEKKDTNVSQEEPKVGETDIEKKNADGENVVTKPKTLEEDAGNGQ